MGRVERYSPHHELLKRSSAVLCTPTAAEEFCSAIRGLEEATVARARPGALLTELAGFRRPYLVQGRIDVSAVSSEAAAEKARTERLAAAEEIPVARLGETVAHIGPFRGDAYNDPLIPAWMREDVEILREISKSYETAVPPSYKRTISKASLHLFMIYAGMTLTAMDVGLQSIHVAVTVGDETRETREATEAGSKVWVHVLSDGGRGVLALSKLEKARETTEWKPTALYLLVDDSTGSTMESAQTAQTAIREEMGHLTQRNAPFRTDRIDWRGDLSQVEIVLQGAEARPGVTAQLACVLLLQRICAPDKALLECREGPFELNFEAIRRLWGVTSECILSQLAALPLMPYATERWALAEDEKAKLQQR
jgi:hypothetical protein